MTCVNHIEASYLQEQQPKIILIGGKHLAFEPRKGTGGGENNAFQIYVFFFSW